jgi:hypothetical protein
MQLQRSRRGHSWCAIGADVECLWCGESYIAFNSAPFCTTAHRLLWNQRRKPRRPGMLSLEQEQEVLEEIRMPLGLHEEVEQQEERRRA